MPDAAPESPFTQVTALATDALYVAVGFGILAFQRLQVHRRELEARVEQNFGPEVIGVVRTVEERAGAAVRDVVELISRQGAGQ
jgi:hypothetical protein